MGLVIGKLRLELAKSKQLMGKKDTNMDNKFDSNLEGLLHSEDAFLA